MNSKDLLDRRRRVVPDGVFSSGDLTIDRATGARVTDLEGRELIDFAGGIGVVNAGHCPEPVVRAIQEQAERFIHASFNVLTYEPYVELCEALVELFPHGDATKAMLVTTGAEAVENAIKIARQATKRQAVLCYTGAFHGRTMMAMTLTSKVGYKTGCGPFAPEVYRLPFPNHYRYGNGLDVEAYAEQELKRLRESALNVVAPDNIAAIIIELVQGEGGFNVAPKSYVEGLRRFCDEHGIVLIFDEVQAGFGRTGAWSSYEHFGVTPDLSTWAKSMGSGMPISAVVGRAEVMDAAAVGTIGGTYIGNPLSCAAALATIRYMRDNDINARGREVGRIVRERFEGMQRRFPCIGDVRGLGAMMALEFVEHGDPRQPDAATCAALVKACAERGLILLSAGTHKNVVRVLGPLVAEDELLTRGLDIMEEELARIVGAVAV